jgi:threonine dehydrogenase-like Zn-dependent dehydrogenase
MKALTFHGKETIRYESVPDPRIESAGDAIIRVSLTAVCGSDLHVYREREKGQDRGTVMGHEFVGEVVEVGGAVTRFERGTRVLSPFTTSCGTCFFCRRGLTCRCEQGQLFGWVVQGVGLQGAQAEYIRVPLADSTLLRIPDGMTDEEALLLCDIVPTGYFCADRAGIAPEGTYAVIGSGPVGLMAIAGAREFGARRIYAVDPVSYRLEHAGRFGAVPIDPAQVDPADILREATEGRGADAILEAVGTEEATRIAFDLVRRGGTIAAVGVHGEESPPFMQSEAYNKNLTYRIGRCPARHYMERLVPVMQAKRYPFASIITHRLPLSEGRHAYRIFDQKLENCVKVVLHTEGRGAGPA